MSVRGITGLLAASLVMGAACVYGQSATQPKTFIGFDRNDYPGDAALAGLHKSFRFTGYWLNTPPGAQRNTWAGKRALLKQHGFGFLLLFNGRRYAELRGKDAVALGSEDGKAAVAAALHEGFAHGTLIFLDQEEGGRLLPEQAYYLFAWADAVRAAGGRAGVYCSAIDVPDGSSTISTARDLVQRESAQGKTAEHRLKLWIANDQCPPAPGCTLAHKPMRDVLTPELAASVVAWQYAQSPRRTAFTAQCPANYASDGNCYAPGVAPGANSFVDLNVASLPDPSEAR